MAISQEFKYDFIQAMRNSYPSFASNNVLPNPSFVESGNTTYITDVENETSYKANDLEIIRVAAYENKTIVLLQDQPTKQSVFAIYDDQGSLLSVLEKQTTGNNPERFTEIIDFKITRNGLIYGLTYGLKNTPDENNICFFILNDILDQLVYLNDQEIIDQTYFITLFNVENVVLDSNGEWQSGSDYFQLITDPDNRFDFSQDFKEEFKFSFVMWDSTNKKIYFTQFSTDLGQNDASQANWLYNDDVALNNGQNLPSTNFDGISELGLGTGEEISTNQQTTLKTIGSIVFSTQQDAGVSIQVPWINQYPLSKPIQSSMTLNSNKSEAENRVEKDLTLLSKSAIDDIIKQYDQAVSVAATPTDYKLFVYIESTTGNNPKQYSYEFDKDVIDQIRAAQDYSITLDDADGTIYHREETVGLGINGIQENTDYFYGEGDLHLNIDGNATLLENHVRGYIKTSGASGEVLREYGGSSVPGVISISTEDFYHKTYYEFKVTTQFEYVGLKSIDSLGSNISSQIMIQQEDNNDVQYNIFQSENNSYAGTAPVFFSGTKAYIPLKTKDTNNFSIFEFTGETSQTQSEVNKVYTDVAGSDYDDNNNDPYTAQLLDAIDGSIKVTVKTGTTERPRGFNYDAATNTITITGTIDKDDIITIEYKTYISAPLRLSAIQPIEGNDLFIGSTFDYKELNSQTTSIFAVGDNSTESSSATETYGINLYSSAPNIDYDQTAQTTTQLDMRVRHVIGYRQKNLLFIVGYNDDYTQYVKFVQIYPDAFEPYTYEPYDNITDRFVLKRLNVNKDNDRSKTNFDRAFLDLTSSTQQVLATTTAQTTDLNNQDNNKVIVYGRTNKPIFEIDKQIIKTEQENLQLNIRFETGFIDNVMGNEISRTDISKTMTSIFTNPNQDFSHFQFGDSYVLLESFNHIDFDANNYIINNDDKLTFAISLYNKDAGENFDHKPVAIVINNKYGEKLFEIDLTENQCDGHVTNISFDIVISDNKGGQ